MSTNAASISQTTWARQPLRYIRRWISGKPLEIEGWFQRTINRKWHMGYRMVTWPMTSPSSSSSSSSSRYWMQDHHPLYPDSCTRAVALLCSQTEQAGSSTLRLVLLQTPSHLALTEKQFLLNSNLDDCVFSFNEWRVSRCSEQVANNCLVSEPAFVLLMRRRKHEPASVDERHWRSFIHCRSSV